MPIDLDALVLSNTRLTRDYNVVSLQAPEMGRVALPGQFVMLKPGLACDPLLRRPFSIFEILRDPAGQASGISILNKGIGVGTRLLLGIRPETRIRCLGPLGQPFVPVEPPAHAWMVAGGVGLAPFATLTEQLRARGTPATLFYGARSAEELLCLELFERHGVTLSLSTEDGSRGVKGYITRPLEQALLDAPLSNIVLYCCGPTAMMRAVARLAARFRRECHVSLEQVMGCGLGGCYSCVVPVASSPGPGHYVRSCIEGPVFNAGEVVWDRLEGHA